MGAGKMTLTSPTGKIEKLEFQAGVVHWSPAGGQHIESHRGLSDRPEEREAGEVRLDGPETHTEENHCGGKVGDRSQVKRSARRYIFAGCLAAARPRPMCRRCLCNRCRSATSSTPRTVSPARTLRQCRIPGSAPRRRPRRSAWTATSRSRRKPGDSETRRIPQEGRGSSWKRVYRLPDYVAFSHRAHVTNAKAACETCHGAVRESDVIRKEKAINMAACMDCHKLPGLPWHAIFCHEQR